MIRSNCEVRLRRLTNRPLEREASIVIAGNNLLVVHVGLHLQGEQLGHAVLVGVGVFLEELLMLALEVFVAVAVIVAVTVAMAVLVLPGSPVNLVAVLPGSLLKDLPDLSAPSEDLLT